jgi:RNA polymerase sigma-70 factor (ECF subfamily)
MDTPLSLLERLRRPADRDAWDRFVRLYTPLLYHWACRLGLQESDAADLVQDALTLLFRKLPDFSYDPSRSFRGWLRTVLLNLWRTRRRLPAPPVQAGEAALDSLAREEEAPDLDEAEYRRHLAGRALELMRTDFRPATWKAFWECAVAGRPTAEVAAELGMSVGAVRVARSRVLARLRQELNGLLD